MSWNSLVRPRRQPMLISPSKRSHKAWLSKQETTKWHSTAMCKNLRQKRQQMMVCHTCGNASRPFGTKDSLSFHTGKYRLKVLLKLANLILVHQVPRIYVLTRLGLNDRTTCIRPNGPEILSASNFPFRLLASAFYASGFGNAKPGVHAQY